MGPPSQLRNLAERSGTPAKAVPLGAY